MKLRIELGDIACECELETLGVDHARKSVASFFSRMIHLDKAAGPPIKYQIRYDGHVENRKLEVIKEIRHLSSIGLKEAKDASESFGGILGIVIGDNEKTRWLSALRKAGATVEAIALQ